MPSKFSLELCLNHNYSLYCIINSNNLLKRFQNNFIIKEIDSILKTFLGGF